MYKKSFTTSDTDLLRWILIKLHFFSLFKLMSHCLSQTMQLPTLFWKVENRTNCQRCWCVRVETHKCLTKIVQLKVWYKSLNDLSLILKSATLFWIEKPSLKTTSKRIKDFLNTSPRGVYLQGWILTKCRAYNLWSTFW